MDVAIDVFLLALTLDAAQRQHLCKAGQFWTSSWSVGSPCHCAVWSLSWLWPCDGFYIEVSCCRSLFVNSQNVATSPCPQRYGFRAVSAWCWKPWCPGSESPWKLEGGLKAGFPQKILSQFHQLKFRRKAKFWASLVCPSPVDFHLSNTAPK